MKSDTSTPTVDYSSSGETERSAPTEAIIELGKKIVAELKFQERGETLGRWMSFRLAELLTEEEETAGADKEAAQQKLQSLILAIWKHRHSLADGSRPFESFETLFSTLNTIADEERSYRFYGGILGQAEDRDAEDTAQKWLNLARSTDDAARTIVHFSLVAAAKEIEQEADVEGWLEAARELSGDEAYDVVIIRGLLNDEQYFEEDPSDAAIATLQKRIDRLDDFSSTVESVKSVLKTRIADLRAAKDADKLDEGSASVAGAHPAPD